MARSLAPRHVFNLNARTVGIEQGKESNMNSSETDRPQEASTTEPGKRRRGGQPGNQNGRKYGVYSRYVPGTERVLLDGMSPGSMEDELTLARARLLYALERTDAAQEEAERIAWDAACLNWLLAVVRIIQRGARNMQMENEVWDTFMEACEAANRRDGLK